MRIEIEPYVPERVEAVRAFNQRLEAGGCAFRFPEESESGWLPKTKGEAIHEELFLAVEGSAVRGGYILKHQPFWLDGDVVSLGYCYLPLSEGTVNPRYGKVGLQLLLNALKRHPLLYSLGLGGTHSAYLQLLTAAGWRMRVLPFHFLVLNPSVFCKNITVLRHRAPMRIGLDLLARTGVGDVAIRAIHALRRHPPDTAHPTTVEHVREFSTWADTLWRTGRTGYTLVAIRDRAALQRLYPAANEKFLKLKATDGETVVGWAVTLDTRMMGHKQFGNMRVGSIIDCFAVPGRENEVIRAATEFLAQRGVDLIVSNQSHRQWSAAFDRAGFLRGPSNFILAASPKLAAHIWARDSTHLRIHFTRGDGQGPSHL